MRISRPRYLALGVLVWLSVGLVLACGKDTSPGGGGAGDAPPPGAGERVQLAGGVQGTLTGPASGRGVVIISEQGGQAAWNDVATELTRAGYRVLVYTRPAQGSAGAARAAAAALLARGVEKVALVGSREGGADVLAAPGDAVGLILVNPTARPDPLPAAGMPPTPMLVIASLGDAEGSAVARRLYAAAAEPREMVLVPGAAASIPSLIAATAPASAPASATPGTGGGVRGELLDFLRAAFTPATA
jgi:hypothetical protein